MPMTATATAPVSRSRLVACATTLRRFPLSVLQLLFRLAIAGVFLRAGLQQAGELGADRPALPRRVQGAGVPGRGRGHHGARSSRSAARCC